MSSSLTSVKGRDLVSAISSKTQFDTKEEKDRIIAGMKWLGLFSDSPITPRENPLDTLCATLEEKMQYEKGERDMCILQHKFHVEYKDGKKVFPPTPSLLSIGNPDVNHLGLRRPKWILEHG